MPNVNLVWRGVHRNPDGRGAFCSGGRGLWRRVMMVEKVQGEGDYEAARRYDDKVSAHARDGQKVKVEAEAAKRAVEGAEGAELEAAEKAGRAHAKK